MNLHYTPEQTDLKNRVREFVRNDVLPVIGEYEAKSVLPTGVFNEMGRRGFVKAHVPKEFGGGGLGALGYCLMSEEIAKGGAGLTHNGHYQLQKMLLEFGTPRQRDKYLDGLLEGRLLGAMAITEPHVGSSFKGMSTAIERKDSGYVLNGVKSFINDAAEADVIGILARGEQGFSVLLLDQGAPGFRMIRKLDPIGFRSSPVYDFEMADCGVDPESVLGDLGQGLKLFFSAFNFSRIGNASAALGIAEAAFQVVLDYAKSRSVGQNRVTDFQGIRWAFAEMSAQIEAARLLRDRAALACDEARNTALESSQAKLFCVEAANRVVGECIQISGRYGCLREGPLEMYYRDARALGVAGGSLEVMKNNIARELIGD